MQAICVRMGGKKRSIPIEKIKKKTEASVAFTKRRKGLFSKATELCNLSPNTQIAILATPLSSNSHASFYSFGYCSVDHVVSALLHDQSPLPTNQLRNRRSGLWWEDERFDSSENVDELKEVIDALSKMLNKVGLSLDNAVKSNQRGGANLVIHQEDEKVRHQLRNTTVNNKNEETKQQVANVEGPLVIHKEEEVLQNCKTEKNNNEETTNQIPKFGGAAGFGSLLEIEDDGLHLDDFLSDFTVGPL